MFFSVLSFTLLQQYLDASEQSISLLKDECSVKKSAVRGALAFLCVYTVHMLPSHVTLSFIYNISSKLSLIYSRRCDEFRYNMRSKGGQSWWILNENARGVPLRRLLREMCFILQQIITQNITSRRSFHYIIRIN